MIYKKSYEIKEFESKERNQVSKNRGNNWRGSMKQEAHHSLRTWPWSWWRWGSGGASGTERRRSEASSGCWAARPVCTREHHVSIQQDSCKGLHCQIHCSHHLNMSCYWPPVVRPCGPGFISSSAHQLIRLNTKTSMTCFFKQRGCSHTAGHITVHSFI